MELKKEILEILRMDAKIQNKNIAAMLGVTEEQVAAAIETLGVSPSVRGEALTLEQFAALCNALSE